MPRASASMESVRGGADAQPLFDCRVKVADRDAAHGDRRLARLQDTLIPHDCTEINDFSAIALPGMPRRSFGQGARDVEGAQGCRSIIRDSSGSPAMATASCRPTTRRWARTPMPTDILAFDHPFPREGRNRFVRCPHRRGRRPAGPALRRRSCFWPSMSPSRIRKAAAAIRGNAAADEMKMACRTVETRHISVLRQLFLCRGYKAVRHSRTRLGNDLRGQGQGLSLS